MRYLITVLLIISAYGAGVVMGWDSGVRDAQNLMVTTP